MHDRQIAATAILLRETGEPVVLLTKDVDILRAGVVTTAW